MGKIKLMNLSAYSRGRSEYSHLFAVTAVGVSVLDFCLGNAEVEGEGLFETGGVESGESSDLVGLETRVDEGYEAGDVGGVEYDNEELGIVIIA